MASFSEIVADFAMRATDDVLVAKMSFQLQALLEVEPDGAAMHAFAVGAVVGLTTAVGLADELCGEIPPGASHPSLRPHEAGAVMKLCSELAAAFARVAQDAQKGAVIGT